MSYIDIKEGEFVSVVRSSGSDKPTPARLDPVKVLRYE